MSTATDYLAVARQRLAVLRDAAPSDPGPPRSPTDLNALDEPAAVAARGADPLGLARTRLIGLRGLSDGQPAGQEHAGAEYEIDEKYEISTRSGAGNGHLAQADHDASGPSTPTASPDAHPEGLGWSDEINEINEKRAVPAACIDCGSPVPAGYRWRRARCVRVAWLATFGRLPPAS